jgi:Zn-dependent peptidase ImmA (M78 family)
MANVAIKGNVLRWILDRSGESVESLRTRSRFKKIGEWLDETSEPTFAQIEDLSKATETPLGWFFLNEPVSEELSIPFFRTLSNKPLRGASAELLDTYYTIQLRQEWIKDYYIDEGRAPLGFVNSVSPDATGEQVARRMRQILGFPDDWTLTSANPFSRLRRAMEQIGIFVVISGYVGNNTSRTLNPEEFRGFVMVDEYAPFVFVNGADFKSAKMFTLAHELSHIFFGRSAIFDLKELRPSSDSIERACNQSAAEFLVPENILRRLWPKTGSSINKIRQVSEQFKVSRVVIARRASDLKIISKSEFSDYYAMYSSAAKKKKKKEKGGPGFYTGLPSRIGETFGRAVIQALRAGTIQYTEAYSLTGLNRKTFDSFATDLQQAGQE